MNIPNEVLTPVLALVFFILGGLVVLVVSKLNEKTKDIIDLVLELVENFVVSNKDLLDKSYKEFAKKIQKWIENTLKIDLTEEQWAIIDEKIQELYNKLREELKKEEENSNKDE